MKDFLLTINLLIALSATGSHARADDRIPSVVGDAEVGSDAFRPWSSGLVSDYEARYGFGESESEWSLRLIIDGDDVYAQVLWAAPSESSPGWVPYYENLHNVRIEGSKFFSDEVNGEFVVYNHFRGLTKGLRLYKSWGNPGFDFAGFYEVGRVKPKPLAYGFDGTCKKPSMRHLSEGELLGMSRADLGVMRNEIFARYGYIFKADGKMDRYFRKQKWYRATHEDVNRFLTDLEKRNLKLIIAVENKQ